MTGEQLATLINQQKTAADLFGAQPGGWRQSTAGPSYEDAIDPKTGWPTKRQIIHAAPAPLSPDQNKLLESLRRQNADYQSRIMKLRTEYEALQSQQRKLQDSAKSMKSWAPSQPQIHVQAGPWETGFGRENISKWLARQSQPSPSVATNAAAGAATGAVTTPSVASQSSIPNLKPSVPASPAPRRLWTLS